MKIFKVGVFDDEDKPNRKPMAYTRWYSPEWEGCCVHEVWSDSGEDAKKVAIKEHVEKCRAGKVVMRHVNS